MSTISAGVTVPTALNLSGDTTGALTFQVSGTVTAATIDTSGNVGIGTASPVQLLTVESTSNVRATIRNSTENTSYASSLDFATGSGSLASTNIVGRVQALITQADPSALQGALAFITNSGDSATEKMRITSGGEVYIAGTTDQGAYNLQCNGTGVWGAGAYVNGSDARLKDSIQSLDSCLDVVKAMRPVTFQYKPEYSKDQNVQPGFIAQELQTAMAGKTYLEGVVQEGTNHLNVAYQNIIPILVKAMQEQQEQIKTLQDRIAELETK